MTDTEFLELAMRHQDGALSAAETSAFETAMRADPAKRRLFTELQMRSMALHERFRQEAFRAEPAPRKHATWSTRPLTAMAAGLVIGLFSASIMWALSAPKATTERLFSLQNGGFEERRLERGFPRQTGLWSGDEAEIVAGGSEERQMLRFVNPGSDAADPSGRAISCDVFQMVDVRPLRSGLAADADAVLELSADFLDDLPDKNNSSVIFTAQLFLFSGDPAEAHAHWPHMIKEALASGAALVTTRGADHGRWRHATTRSLLPAEATYAVIQLAARPDLRPTKLDSLFVDNVRLTLKTQPALPVRLAQR